MNLIGNGSWLDIKEALNQNFDTLLIRKKPRDILATETDDTARVQELITEGGNLYFPSGRYVISSNILITESIDVLCDEDTEFYLADASNCKMFYTDRDKVDVSNYVIWDGGILNGNATGQVVDFYISDGNHDVSRGFQLLKLDKVVIKNVLIKKIEGHAINHWNCNYVEFRNIEIDQGVEPDSHPDGGVRHDGITGCSVNMVMDNIYGFTDDDFIAITPGHDWYHAGTCNVENCWISNIEMKYCSDDATFATYRGLGIYVASGYYLDNLYIDGVKGCVNTEFIKPMGTINNMTVSNVNVEHSPKKEANSNGAFWFSLAHMGKLTLNNFKYNWLEDTYTCPFCYFDRSDLETLVLDNIDLTYEQSSTDVNYMVALDTESVVNFVSERRININLKTSHTFYEYKRIIPTGQTTLALKTGSEGVIDSELIFRGVSYRDYLMSIKMGIGVANTGGIIRLKTISLVEQGGSTNLIDIESLQSTTSVTVSDDGGLGKLLTVTDSGHLWPNVPYTLSTLTEDVLYDFDCTYEVLAGTEELKVEFMYTATGVAEGIVDPEDITNRYNLFVEVDGEMVLQSATPDWGETSGEGTTVDDIEYAISVIGGTNLTLASSSECWRVGNVVHGNLKLYGTDNAGSFSAGDLLVEFDTDFMNHGFEFVGSYVTTGGRFISTFEFYDGSVTQIKATDAATDVRWMHLNFTYLIGN